MPDRVSHQYVLLYILGSGHCGSTLLDLLLNGHSQVLGLGEIRAMHRYIALAKGAGLPSSPGKDWLEVKSHPFDTPLWQKVRECYEATSGRQFDEIDLRFPRWSKLLRWQEGDIKKWNEPNEALLMCLHKVSGAKVLTDSSKSPHRLYLLRKAGVYKIKVIHLVRDGRAIVNSYLRKYGDIMVALRRWAGPALTAFYLKRLFPERDWLRVRYERLCTDPEGTLKEICSFVRIEFEPQMLAYRSHPYFGIGGNRMREGSDERIYLDEAWKQQLSLKHRLTFALTVGWVNKIYGYGIL
ncbi:MAG: hypothetical protein DRI61_03885 [Chloroflexi bacterium]|nr:MAG: hypothetical protein DRI61_03885 [Chloroflexota bacterium]